MQLAAETTCVQRTHALPDGRAVRLGGERFAAPEALFQPSLLGVESPGLAELVFRCVQVGGAFSPACCYQPAPLWDSARLALRVLGNPPLAAESPLSVQRLCSEGQTDTLGRCS